MCRFCLICRVYKFNTLQARAIVFFVNLLLMAFAVVIVTIGASYKLRIDEYTDLFDTVHQEFILVPTITAIIGIFVFFIAFLGTCGAVTPSIGKLLAYVVFLVLMFLVQSGVIGLLMMETSYESDEHEFRFKKRVYMSLLQILIRYNESIFAKEWMDMMQQHFDCCGIATPCDWVVLTNNTGAPYSCCKPGATFCNQSLSYQRGCLLPVFDYIRENLEWIGGWLAWLTVLELIAALLSVCLANMLRVDELIYDYPTDRYIRY